jgi:hypothetical protein
MRRLLAMALLFAATGCGQRTPCERFIRAQRQIARDLGHPTPHGSAAPALETCSVLYDELSTTERDQFEEYVTCVESIPGRGYSRANAILTQLGCLQAHRVQSEPPPESPTSP